MNETAIDCPVCNVELKHYPQPYVMGGVMDTYYCTKGHYSVNVLPLPSETVDPFTSSAPGARDGEWVPSYLIDSDLMME